ncbi:hypothetical protein HMI54_004781 [Coelomomyces lativittatus]|nr:hypothetical protein HMI55_002476 [Coelomomyces lativittatus]KAJ1503561.1 hypothetical protein HMI56_002077 [Coelomomyces lativittatus]KAJ1506828.1 hypothetical protein HMI54_004781 [Coelomomyces lativittatus]
MNSVSRPTISYTCLVVLLLVTLFSTLPSVTSINVKGHAKSERRDAETITYVTFEIVNDQNAAVYKEVLTFRNYVNDVKTSKKNEGAIEYVSVCYGETCLTCSTQKCIKAGAGWATNDRYYLVKSDGLEKVTDVTDVPAWMAQTVANSPSINNRAAATGNPPSAAGTSGNPPSAVGATGNPSVQGRNEIPGTNANTGVNGNTGTDGAQGAAGGAQGKEKKPDAKENPKGKGTSDLKLSGDDELEGNSTPSQSSIHVSLSLMVYVFCLFLV